MDESTGLGYQLGPKSDGDNHSAPSPCQRDISEGVVFVSASSQYDDVEEDDKKTERADNNSLETYSLNDGGCDSSNAAIVDEGEKAQPEQQSWQLKQQHADLIPPSQPRHHDETPQETTAAHPPPFPLPPPHPPAIASQYEPLHNPQKASFPPPPPNVATFPSFPPPPATGPIASPIPHFQMQQHSNLPPPLAPPPPRTLSKLFFGQNDERPVSFCRFIIFGRFFFLSKNTSVSISLLRLPFRPIRTKGIGIQTTRQGLETPLNAVLPVDVNEDVSEGNVIFQGGRRVNVRDDGEGRGHVE
mmetsp:Transcript_17667/g.36837  ORF Transcript_17667/g.36837 Transcript_17667/m.36837 type:complete len:301 (+) Transcript_17667:95-997(+)